MADFQLRSTGGELVTQLMKSMGMTPPSDIAGSTDKNCIQLWELATEVGQQLAFGEGNFEWQELSREFIITTVIGQSAYNLPADFNGFVTDSEWNRTTRLPVIGSLQQFEWQMLKARLLTGTTFTALFRVQGGQVVFYDTPSSVQTIVLPYQSRGWVLNNDGVTYQDNLINNNDMVLFDPLLFKLGLKLRWFEAKGFDTTKIQAQYDRVLRGVKATDSPGRTLSLAKGADYPYLGVINIPDTGYGS